MENSNANPPFVSLDHVSMAFGDIVSVADVSFSVPAGTIWGLVGSDGAGKTTLLRMIALMLKPQAGGIHVGGLDVLQQRGEVKKLLGYMPQRFALYQDLTVQENMEFFLDIYGITGKERAARKERYLGFTGLLPFMDRYAGNLSGGMKQKLGLACVLVHEPKLLVLDEPTNGVDPVSRREFWDMLFRMRDGGMTILVATAYMDEGERCQYLGIMHRAKLLAVATPEKIRGDAPNLEESIKGIIRQKDKDLEHGAFSF
ncbi:MAG: ABC transporter ATP-binding protein [Syntrophaceae bacterium]|nr:ABC transporter ATP-binding protein [Syntrophaceae bacterium]